MCQDLFAQCLVALQVLHLGLAAGQKLLVTHELAAMDNEEFKCLVQINGGLYLDCKNGLIVYPGDGGLIVVHHG